MEKLDKKSIIVKFRLKHNKQYDYSKVEYKNTTTKVIITCKEHGDFLQTPKSHLNGCGCPECGKGKMTGRKVGTGFTTEEFIEKSISIHGDKYGYSLVNYINNDNKVDIICPIHGVFTQEARGHLSGRGCSKCGRKLVADKLSTNTTISTEVILDRFNKKHNNKYTYPYFSYNRRLDSINIKCPKYGIFNQVVDYHLNGRGCTKCGFSTSKSKGEQEIEYFVKQFVEVESNNRSLLKKNELDIYIPSKNLAIEYNGLHWHSELYKDRNYHYNKTMACKEKEVQLLHIFEDDWVNKKTLVKSFLKSKLGIFEKKINGRQCQVREVDSKVAYNFLDENHLQGKVSATNYLGLFHKEELVSLILFKKINDKIYDLNRFCSKQNYLVRGGFSKLLKHFTKTNKNVEEIITFSDNTYSDGGLYKTNEFKEVSIIAPDYKYIKDNIRKHKFGFRKINLKKLFKNTENKTEHQITLENKLYRIYDAGKTKYSYKPNKKI
jgi:hypothetical protein